MMKMLQQGKPLLWLVLVAFLVNTVVSQPVYADVPFLPVPGTLVSLTPSFAPSLIRGIKVFKDNPFKFEFVMSQGENTPSFEKGQSSWAKKMFLKQEGERLVKYFLAALTIPEKDLWVNLSPYEHNRIIPKEFGVTEMGKELLAQDYLLKQVTASVMYPEGSVGKGFWQKIYQEAYKRFGTTNVPVNTYNKVWIVPDTAAVYENATTNTAVIIKSRLKVMLEQDYMALAKHHVPEKKVVENISIIPAQSVVYGNSDMQTLGSQIVRLIILPELTKEVNSGKNFAALRQVYNSLILALWYKNKLKNSLIAQGYVDRKKISGVDVQDKRVDEKIYQQYLKSYKKGVYNYIKQEMTPDNAMIPRKYFSGGVSWAMVAVRADSGMLSRGLAQKALSTDSALLSVVLNTTGISALAKRFNNYISGKAQSKLSRSKLSKELLAGRDSADFFKSPWQRLREGILKHGFKLEDKEVNFDDLFNLHLNKDHLIEHLRKIGYIARSNRIDRQKMKLGFEAFTKELDLKYAPIADQIFKILETSLIRMEPVAFSKEEFLQGFKGADRFIETLERFGIKVPGTKKENSIQRLNRALENRYLFALGSSSGGLSPRENRERMEMLFEETPGTFEDIFSSGKFDRRYFDQLRDGIDRKVLWGYLEKEGFIIDGKVQRDRVKEALILLDPKFDLLKDEILDFLQHPDRFSTKKKQHSISSVLLFGFLIMGEMTLADIAVGTEVSATAEATSQRIQKKELKQLRAEVSAHEKMLQDSQDSISFMNSTAVQAFLSTGDVNALDEIVLNDYNAHYSNPFKDLKEASTSATQQASSSVESRPITVAEPQSTISEKSILVEDGQTLTNIVKHEIQQSLGFSVKNIDHLAYQWMHSGKAQVFRDGQIHHNINDIRVGDIVKFNLSDHVQAGSSAGGAGDGGGNNPPVSASNADFQASVPGVASLSSNGTDQMPALNTAFAQNSSSFLPYLNFFKNAQNAQTGLFPSFPGVFDQNPNILYLYDHALSKIAGLVLGVQTVPSTAVGMNDTIDIRNGHGNFEETKAGSSAWEALAGLHAYQITGNADDLKNAEDILSYVINQLQDENGGFYLTADNHAKATENAESLIATLDMAYRITQNTQYQIVANKAYTWVKGRYDFNEHRFKRGMQEDGSDDNDIALDNFTWISGILGRILEDSDFGNNREERLAELERMAAFYEVHAGVFQDNTLIGVSFGNDQHDILWLEGTAQMKLMFDRMAQEFKTQGNVAKALEYQRKSDNLLASLDRRIMLDKSGHLWAPYAEDKDGQIAVEDTTHGWNTPDGPVSVSAVMYYLLAKTHIDPLADMNKESLSLLHEALNQFPQAQDQPISIPSKLNAVAKFTRLLRENHIKQQATLREIEKKKAEQAAYQRSQIEKKADADDFVKKFGILDKDTFSEEQLQELLEAKILLPIQDATKVQVNSYRALDTDELHRILGDGDEYRKILLLLEDNHLGLDARPVKTIVRTGSFYDARDGLFAQDITFSPDVKSLAYTQQRLKKLKRFAKTPIDHLGFPISGGILGGNNTMMLPGNIPSSFAAYELVSSPMTTWKPGISFYANQGYKIPNAGIPTTTPGTPIASFSLIPAVPFRGLFTLYSIVSGLPQFATQTLSNQMLAPLYGLDTILQLEDYVNKHPARYQDELLNFENGIVSAVLQPLTFTVTPWRSFDQMNQPIEGTSYGVGPIKVFSWALGQVDFYSGDMGFFGNSQTTFPGQNLGFIPQAKEYHQAFDIAYANNTDPNITYWQSFKVEDAQTRYVANKHHGYDKVDSSLPLDPNQEYYYLAEQRGFRLDIQQGKGQAVFASYAFVTKKYLEKLVVASGQGKFEDGILKNTLKGKPVEVLQEPIVEKMSSKTDLENEVILKNGIFHGKLILGVYRDMETGRITGFVTDYNQVNKAVTLKTKKGGQIQVLPDQPLTEGSALEEVWNLMQDYTGDQVDGFLNNYRGALEKLGVMEKLTVGEDIDNKGIDITKRPSINVKQGSFGLMIFEPSEALIQVNQKGEEGDGRIIHPETVPDPVINMDILKEEGRLKTVGFVAEHYGESAGVSKVGNKFKLERFPNEFTADTLVVLSSGSNDLKARLEGVFIPSQNAFEKGLKALQQEQKDLETLQRASKAFGVYYDADGHIIELTGFRPDVKTAASAGVVGQFFGKGDKAKPLTKDSLVFTKGKRVIGVVEPGDKWNEYVQTHDLVVYHDQTHEFVLSEELLKFPPQKLFKIEQVMHLNPDGTTDKYLTLVSKGHNLALEEVGADKILIPLQNGGNLVFDEEEFNAQLPTLEANLGLASRETIIKGEKKKVLSVKASTGMNGVMTAVDGDKTIPVVGLRMSNTWEKYLQNHHLVTFQDETHQFMLPDALIKSSPEELHKIRQVSHLKADGTTDKYLTFVSHGNDNFTLEEVGDDKTLIPLANGGNLVLNNEELKAQWQSLESSLGLAYRAIEIKGKKEIVLSVKAHPGMHGVMTAVDGDKISVVGIRISNTWEQQVVNPAKAQINEGVKALKAFVKNHPDKAQLALMLRGLKRFIILMAVLLLARSSIVSHKALEIIKQPVGYEGHNTLLGPDGKTAPRGFTLDDQVFTEKDIPKFRESGATFARTYKPMPIALAKQLKQTFVRTLEVGIPYNASAYIDSTSPWTRQLSTKVNLKDHNAIPYLLELARTLGPDFNLVVSLGNELNLSNNEHHFARDNQEIYGTVVDSNALEIENAFKQARLKITITSDLGDKPEDYRRIVDWTPHIHIWGINSFRPDTSVDADWRRLVGDNVPYYLSESGAILNASDAVQAQRMIRALENAQRTRKAIALMTFKSNPAKKAGTVSETNLGALNVDGTSKSVFNTIEKIFFGAAPMPSTVQISGIESNEEDKKISQIKAFAEHNPQQVIAGHWLIGPDGKVVFGQVTASDLVSIFTLKPGYGLEMAISIPVWRIPTIPVPTEATDEIDSFVREFIDAFMQNMILVTRNDNTSEFVLISDLENMSNYNKLLDRGVKEAVVKNGKNVVTHRILFQSDGKMEVEVVNSNAEENLIYDAYIQKGKIVFSEQVEKLSVSHLKLSGDNVPSNMRGLEILRVKKFDKQNKLIKVQILSAQNGRSLADVEVRKDNSDLFEINFDTSLLTTVGAVAHNFEFDIDSGKVGPLTGTITNVGTSDAYLPRQAGENIKKLEINVLEHANLDGDVQEVSGLDGSGNLVENFYDEMQFLDNGTRIDGTVAVGYTDKAQERSLYYFVKNKDGKYEVLTDMGEVLTANNWQMGIYGYMQFADGETLNHLPSFMHDRNLNIVWRLDKKKQRIRGIIVDKNRKMEVGSLVPLEQGSNQYLVELINGKSKEEGHRVTYLANKHDSIYILEDQLLVDTSNLLNQRNSYTWTVDEISSDLKTMVLQGSSILKYPNFFERKFQKALKGLDAFKIKIFKSKSIFSNGSVAYFYRIQGHADILLYLSSDTDPNVILNMPFNATDKKASYEFANTGVVLYNESNIKLTSSQEQSAYLKFFDQYGNVGKKIIEVLNNLDKNMKPAILNSNGFTAIKSSVMLDPEHDENALGFHQMRLENDGPWALNLVKDDGNGRLRFILYAHKVGDVDVPVGIASGEVVLDKQTGQIARITEFLMRHGDEYFYRIIYDTREGQVYTGTDRYVSYNLKTDVVREILGDLGIVAYSKGGFSYKDTEMSGSWRNGNLFDVAYFNWNLLLPWGHPTMEEMKTNGAKYNLNLLKGQIFNPDVRRVTFPDERLYNEYKVFYATSSNNHQKYKMVEGIPVSPKIDEVRISLFLEQGGGENLLALAKREASNSGYSWNPYFNLFMRHLQGDRLILHPNETAFSDNFRNSLPGRLIEITYNSADSNKVKDLQIIEAMEQLKSIELNIAQTNQEKNLPVAFDPIATYMFWAIGGVLLSGIGILTLISTPFFRNLRFGKGFDVNDMAMLSIFNRQSSVDQLADIFTQRIKNPLNSDAALRLARRMVSSIVQAGIFVAGKRPDLEYLLEMYIDDYNRKYIKRGLTFDEKVKAIIFGWDMAIAENPELANSLNIQRQLLEQKLQSLENHGTIKRLEDKRLDENQIIEMLQGNGMDQTEINHIVEAHQQGFLKFNEQMKDYYKDSKITWDSTQSWMPQLERLAQKGVLKAVAILDLLDAMNLNQDQKEKLVEQAFARANKRRDEIWTETYEYAREDAYESELIAKIKRFLKAQSKKQLFEDVVTSTHVNSDALNAYAHKEVFITTVTKAMDHNLEGIVRKEINAKSQKIKKAVDDFEKDIRSQFQNNNVASSSEKEIKESVNAFRERLIAEKRNKRKRELQRILSSQLYANYLDLEQDIENSLNKKQDALRSEVDALVSLHGSVFDELYKQIEVEAERQGTQNIEVLRRIMTPEARLAVQLFENGQLTLEQLTQFKDFKNDVTLYVKDKVLRPLVAKVLVIHGFKFDSDEFRELFYERVLAELFWYVAVRPARFPKNSEDFESNFKMIFNPRPAIKSAEPVTYEEYVIYKYLETPKEQTSNLSLGGDAVVPSLTMFLTGYFIHKRKSFENIELYHKFIKNTLTYWRYVFYINNLKQVAEAGSGAAQAISDPVLFGGKQPKTQISETFYDANMTIVFNDFVKRMRKKEASSSTMTSTYDPSLFGEYEGYLKRINGNNRTDNEDIRDVIYLLGLRAKNAWEDLRAIQKDNFAHEQDGRHQYPFDQLWQGTLRPLVAPFIDLQKQIIRARAPYAADLEEAGLENKGLWFMLVNRIYRLFGDFNVLVGKPLARFEVSQFGTGTEVSRLEYILGIKSQKTRTLVYRSMVLGVFLSVIAGAITGQVGLVVAGVHMSLLTIPLIAANMRFKSEKVFYVTAFTGLSVHFGLMSWMLWGKFAAVNLLSAGTFNTAVLLLLLFPLTINTVIQIFRFFKSYYEIRNNLWSHVALRHSNMLFSLLFLPVRMFVSLPLINKTYLNRWGAVNEEKHLTKLNDEYRSIENTRGYIMPNNILFAEHIKNLAKYLLNLGHINEREYQLLVRAVYLGKDIPHLETEEAREYLFTAMTSPAYRREPVDAFARRRPVTTHVQAYNEIVGHPTEKWARHGSMSLVLSSHEEKRIESIVINHCLEQDRNWRDTFELKAFVLRMIKSAGNPPSLYTLEYLESQLRKNKTKTNGELLDKELVDAIMRYLRKLEILHGGVESSLLGYLVRTHPYHYQNALAVLRKKGFNTLADELDLADDRTNFLEILRKYPNEQTAVVAKVFGVLLDELDASNMGVLDSFANDVVTVHLEVAANRADIDYRSAVMLAYAEFGSLQLAYDAWVKESDVDNELKQYFVRKFPKYKEMVDLKNFQMLQMTSMWQNANPSESNIRILSKETLRGQEIDPSLIYGFKQVALRLIQGQKDDEAFNTAITEESNSINSTNKDDAQKKNAKADTIDRQFYLYTQSYISRLGGASYKERFIVDGKDGKGDEVKRFVFSKTKDYADLILGFRQANYKYFMNVNVNSVQPYEEMVDFANVFMTAYQSNAHIPLYRGDEIISTLKYGGMTMNKWLMGGILDTLDALERTLPGSSPYMLHVASRMGRNPEEVVMNPTFIVAGASGKTFPARRIYKMMQEAFSQGSQPGSQGNLLFYGKATISSFLINLIFTPVEDSAGFGIVKAENPDLIARVVIYLWREWIRPALQFVVAATERRYTFNVAEMLNSTPVFETMVHRHIGADFKLNNLQQYMHYLNAPNVVAILLVFMYLMPFSAFNGLKPGVLFMIETGFLMNAVSFFNILRHFKRTGSLGASFLLFITDLVNAFPYAVNTIIGFAPAAFKVANQWFSFVPTFKKSVHGELDKFTQHMLLRQERVAINSNDSSTTKLGIIFLTSALVSSALAVLLRIFSYNTGLLALKLGWFASLPINAGWIAGYLWVITAIIFIAQVLVKSATSQKLVRKHNLNKNDYDFSGVPVEGTVSFIAIMGFLSTLMFSTTIGVVAALAYVMAAIAGLTGNEVFDTDVVVKKGSRLIVGLKPSAMFGDAKALRYVRWSLGFLLMGVFGVTQWVLSFIPGIDNQASYITTLAGVTLAIYFLPAFSNVLTQLYWVLRGHLEVAAVHFDNVRSFLKGETIEKSKILAMDNGAEILDKLMKAGILEEAFLKSDQKNKPSKNVRVKLYNEEKIRGVLGDGADLILKILQEPWKGVDRYLNHIQREYIKPLTIDRDWKFRRLHSDSAQIAYIDKSVNRLANKGGIDLAQTAVKVASSGETIQTAFDDPAMLRVLLNSDGLTPVIYDIQTMTPAMVNGFVGLN